MRSTPGREVYAQMASSPLKSFHDAAFTSEQNFLAAAYVEHLLCQIALRWARKRQFTDANI
ncbi:MAG TPA: hypothetical protein VKU02_07255 [Gemmataceae bacterium]|nr:hypothetical protein [Gemmataceae bacterium]